MEKLVWKKDYSLKNESIDSQHRQIFDLYNQVCDSPHGWTDQEALLRRLYEFAVEHFDQEETLMEQANYQPSMFDHHRTSHRMILSALSKLEKSSLEATMSFFRDWIVDHMVVVDKLLERFLQESYIFDKS